MNARERREERARRRAAEREWHEWQQRRTEAELERSLDRAVATGTRRIACGRRGDGDHGGGGFLATRNDYHGG